LRNENLDQARCKPEFVSAMFDDLRWFGFEWQEGPDLGGRFAPYSQSERRSVYLAVFEQLRSAGFIYPCVCSRQDVLRALQAPHAGEDEPLYPGTCRPRQHAEYAPPSPLERSTSNLAPGHSSTTARNSLPRVNWRFQVPDGEVISFPDGHYGPQHFVAGKDFGDFVVWRHDDIPSYQLAVVADDDAMKVTEVVRGEDLLRSTARQLLLYRALGFTPPAFFHCPLVTDAAGVRLAKRHDSVSLRTLRLQGTRPEDVRRDWPTEP
jgi:glutamyl-tRNA synthetase